MRFEAPRQIEEDFRILKENVEPARNALREFMGADDSVSLEGLMCRQGWTSCDDVIKGGLRGIYLLYPRTPLETDWMDVVAPYVNAGSYIDIFDYDNEPWRIAFDGKECKVIKGEIVYPE